MNREIQQRLQWGKLYEKAGDAGIICRRCGISSTTLRRWWRRYLSQSMVGLESHSRRPESSPSIKTGSAEVALTLELRSLRNLGARRIQSELKRLHSIYLICKVLCQNQAKPVVKFRCKAVFIHYERPVLGGRVQMDTCKVGPCLYQYTSVDDCTRYRVLKFYSRRTAENTLDFIDYVTEEMPFPIQRIQTDRGKEFFAVKVQEKLKAYGIKFRPNK